MSAARCCWDAKASGGTSSVFILGGGSPKNFMLQTEPQIQEVLGLAEAGLNRIIRAGYKLLGLATYFTVGPKEARAWTITKGTRAPATMVANAWPDGARRACAAKLAGKLAMER